MREIKYGYKVVRVTDDGSTLSFVDLLPCSLRYHTGRWTTRIVGNGPLVLFDDTDRATAFVAYDYPTFIRPPPFLAIYRVAYIESRHTTYGLWYKDDDGIEISMKGITGMALPAGTLFADAVCLIEPVKWGECDDWQTSS